MIPASGRLLYEEGIRSVEGRGARRGQPAGCHLSMFPLQARLRNRCGNADEGPHAMRTFPRKYAFGAEIGSYVRSFASRRSPVRLRPLRSLARSAGTGSGSRRDDGGTFAIPAV